jgi:hypothetical protein
MTTEYPLTTWRLLNTHHLDGATNMAIDEAISRAVQANLVPPTLRFFGWRLRAALGAGPTRWRYRLCRRLALMLCGGPLVDARSCTPTS